MTTTELQSALKGSEARLDSAERRIVDVPGIVQMAGPAIFTVIAGHAQGSGFGFHTDGTTTLVATNFHVVDAQVNRGGRVVLVQGSERWIGELWRWDEGTDVAVVRVHSVLPILESAFAFGEPPAVGDIVVAYGSPMGLRDTASLGIISAFRPGMIQTDAQINPGNSGGPLLDREGRVLGLTTWGVGGGGSGLGLAVDIRRLCTDLAVGPC